jgi:hypothetical protein
LKEKRDEEAKKKQRKGLIGKREPYTKFGVLIIGWQE